MEHKFYNRDLSWISFNYRVLMEAKKEDVPLLERLRFIAIYSSNLDEFFRVRVASLRSIQEIDKKKITQSVGLEKNLIQQIHQEIAEQLTDYGQTLGVILEELKAKGLHIGLRLLTERRTTSIFSDQGNGLPTPLRLRYLQRRPVS